MNGDNREVKVQVRNLTKYFGQLHVLDNISFDIKKGEFVCVVGPTGCGKTTFLNLLTKIHEPTSGELRIDGELADPKKHNLAFVFQEASSYPWLTVEKNVSFSLRMQKKQDKELVEHMLKMVGLEDFRKDYPHQLSGGMAQRVALVRSLINHPDILLLDEPLGALDAFTRMNMQDEILNIWREQKQTVVMVTHDVEEAIYMGTRVLVMEPRPGRVKADIPIELAEPKD